MGPRAIGFRRPAFSNKLQAKLVWRLKNQRKVWCSQEWFDVVQLRNHERFSCFVSFLYFFFVFFFSESFNEGAESKIGRKFIQTRDPHLTR
jgi:hypothetical protein